MRLKVQAGILINNTIKNDVKKENLDVCKFKATLLFYVVDDNF